MVHRYKKSKSCPLCGDLVNDFYEMDDGTLACRNCYEEENGEYEDFETEEDDE
jgi:hypothetical protein